MGNSLSASGRGIRRKSSANGASRRAAPNGMEGGSGTVWTAEGPGTAQVVGTVSSTKGGIRWIASAEEILGGAASTASTPHQQCRVSQLFAMPGVSLPAGCENLLALQKWQLCWELADGGTWSLFLRCATLAGDATWRHLGVCCEFSMELRGVAKEGEGGGRGGSTCCFHRREWLSHAFTCQEPDWGLRGVMAGTQAQLHPERMHVEVELQFEGVAAHVQGPLSGLVLQDSPLLLQISEEPCILAMDAFLTPQECQPITELASPYLKHSKVSAGDETPLRTSAGMFITGAMTRHPVAVDLDIRVQQLADLACRLKGRRRLVLSEATQVVRYQRGQFYAAHYDNKQGDCAKRAATIMVYLSDVPQGGTTAFPRSSGFQLSRALEMCMAGNNNHPAAPPDSPPSVLQTEGGGCAPGGEEAAGAMSPPGLHVVPKQGRAIVFWSRLPNGKEDRASIHAAESVVSGVKWIATRWCREET